MPADRPGEWIAGVGGAVSAAYGWTAPSPAIARPAPEPAPPPAASGENKSHARPLRIDPNGALPASLPPRGLSRMQAAAYVGIGPTKFDEMVAVGRMPKPKRVDHRVIWDRLKIDAAFAALGEDGLPKANGAAVAAALNQWDNL
jgi:predicted DNA-binding transcriptional regulator AlpA